ncbi:hypothetical protein FRC17_004591 [Serendipita sp. 399]|nr:hypothetical protein FRC17_004591 [Serendipita sp. 399]
MSTLATLPLQVRVGLRDSFDAPDAPIKQALNSLNGTLGYSISLEIAWVDLWQDLSAKYDDKTTFVPSVTAAITLFLQRLENLLESSESFQEAFLEKMERTRKALFVQIHDKTVPKFEIVRGELLTLFLPKAGASELRSVSSRIGEDIEQAFVQKAKPTSDEGAEALQDDFVDIVPVSRPAGSQRAPKVLSLPSIDTLARPENLFSSILPYTLIVRHTGEGIEIEGSHQPTLQLIHDYFTKYARKNLNDTRQIPHFLTNFVQSAWGSGTYHDAVRISREDNRASWVRVQITPVLAFVEGVCGYELHSSDGAWVFRRYEPFH